MSYSKFIKSDNRGDLSVSVLYEYRGLSTDVKPVLKKSGNGCECYEMDTGDVYMFDGDTLSWLPQQ